MGKTVWCMRAKVFITSLLVCTLTLTTLGCSQAEDTTETAINFLTGAGFDEAVLADRDEEVIEPPTFEDLQAELSAAASTSRPTGIGGYSLGVEETQALNEALNGCTEQGYQAGYILLDISTGQGITYNIDEEFYSASTIKGLYVASLAAQFPEVVELRADSIYAILDHSSDDDYFALRVDYGHDPFVQWCAEAGVDEAIGSEWFPYYSARTFAKLWLKTYEYFDSGSEETEALIPWYGDSFNSAIYQCLGDQYQVCTKAGWIGGDGYSAAADGGIVYAGESPYVIVVMTDAPGDTSLLEPIIAALNSFHNSMV